jgi:hypothetical protein
MEDIKYVEMFTWVCVCGEEYVRELSSLPHSPFDIHSCQRCNIKAGDRVPIAVCRCKSELDKPKEV